MKTGKRLLFFCFTAAAICLMVCAKHDRPDRVVGRIDDFTITYQDFAEQFKRRHGEAALEKADPASQRKVLNEMIDDQITLFEAHRLGVDRDEKIAAIAREKEREFAAKAWRRQEIDDRIVTESLLQRLYQYSDRSLELLYMKFFAGPTAAGQEAALRKADRLYQQIQAGASFKELAFRYSEHTAGRADSGKIGIFDHTTPPRVFFEKAYALQEGGTTPPFFHDRSVWLLQVVKIHPKKRPPFDQARAEILEQAYQLYADEIAGRTRALNDSVLAEYHYQPDAEQIDFFCRRCTGLKTRADSAGLFLPQDRARILSHSEVECTTIGAFFPLVFTHYWSSLDQPQVVQMLLREYSLNRLVKYKAMQMRIHQTAPVKQEYQKWLVYFLKKNVIQRHVIDSMIVPETELAALYERSKPSLVVKKQATVREIFRISKTDIDQVYQMALKGHDFAALQKTYCQNQENRNQGIVGPFPVGMNGKLGELA
ncbi:hypothetical protein GX408_17330, partial [bacterium]|nr:hypothetical protein [bacterium]